MQPIVRHITDIYPIQDVCGELRIFSSAEDFTEANVVIAEMRGPTIPHYHRVATEFYFVVSGQGRVIVASQVLEVKQKSLVVIPPNHTHLTIPKNRMEVLAFSVPAWQESDQIVLNAENGYDDSVEKSILIDELLRRHIMIIKKGQSSKQREASARHQKRILFKENRWDIKSVSELRKDLEVR